MLSKAKSNDSLLTFLLGLTKHEASCGMTEKCFQKLHPNRKLDLVLKNLETYTMSINEIQKSCDLPLKPYTFQVVSLSLERLEKDGYAKIINTYLILDIDNPGHYKEVKQSNNYKVTIEGMKFRTNGGYVIKERWDFIESLPKRWTFLVALLGLAFSTFYQYITYSKQEKPSKEILIIRDTFWLPQKDKMDFVLPWHL